jgi:hypothetical protein
MLQNNDNDSLGKLRDSLLELSISPGCHSIILPHKLIPRQPQHRDDKKTVRTGRTSASITKEMVPQLSSN